MTSCRVAAAPFRPLLALLVQPFVMPFDLLEYFSCFHWYFVQPRFPLHSPTATASVVCQNIFNR